MKKKNKRNSLKLFEKIEKEMVLSKLQEEIINLKNKLKINNENDFQKYFEGLEEKFFDALVKAGYEVKTKDLQIFPGGAKKGDWDVGIAMDAVRLSQGLDAIVLVSGDGDYLPLVEYIQNTTGCRVEVAAFHESTNAKLQEQADSYLDLSADKKFLLTK